MFNLKDLDENLGSIRNTSDDLVDVLGSVNEENSVLGKMNAELDLVK
jgi:hypothetical protein